MRKPALLISFSLGVAFAAIALGSQAHAQNKAAMLLGGSINDQSWNALGYSGLMKLKELGYETAYSENVPAADHVEAMRSRGIEVRMPTGRTRPLCRS